MSLLPEVIIQEILRDGVLKARQNPRVVDMLLRQVPGKVADEIKKTFHDQSLEIVLGFSRKTPVFPCICILLRGEEQGETFLEDFAGGGYGAQWVNPQGEAGTDDTGSPGAYIESEFFRGTTDEQKELQERAGGMIGDPRRLFSEDTYKEKGSVFFDASYLLHIMAQTQEFTIFLYALMKYIIFSNRDKLERNNLKSLTTSGTDLSASPEFMPDFIYSRALALQFIQPFEWFVFDDEMDGFEDIILDIDAHTPSVDKEGVLDGYDVTCVRSVSLTPPVLQSVTPTSIDELDMVELIIQGTNIHADAVASFPDKVYDESVPSGVQIVDTAYIAGNKLKVTVYAYEVGVTDVTVTNPGVDNSDTLSDAITVIAVP